MSKIEELQRKAKELETKIKRLQGEGRPVEPRDTLISRELAAKEVYRHLKVNKLAGIISIVGFVLIGVFYSFSKYSGMVVALVMSIAMVFMVYKNQTEMLRLEKYYKLK